METHGVHHSNVELGEDEQQHHEKKSVLKKVKAKAKKIKDTLTKHGHGEEDVDDDDDDEEVDEDPEVHGTPRERKFAVEDAISGQQRDYNVRNLPRTDVGPEMEGLKLVAGEGDTRKSPELERDPHAPREPGESYSPGNYESKVTDPTRSGGGEADVDPIVGDFKAMNVANERKYGPEGSHDQFSPEKTAGEASTYGGKIASAASTLAGTAVSAKDAVASKLGYGGTDRQTESNESASGSTDAKHPGEPTSAPATYAGKIASAVAGTAVSAKDAVASKIGYGGGGKPESNDSPQPERDSGGEKDSGYGERIKATVAPVCEKVADAGIAAATKIRGAATGEEVKVEETEGGVKRSITGVPLSKYLSERLRPGEEHRALSQLISDTIHKRNDSPETEQTASVEVPESAGSGMGVVGLIRGAVTSLFGKGGETHVSSGRSEEAEHVGQENGGGQRLQESGN